MLRETRGLLTATPSLVISFCSRLALQSGLSTRLDVFDRVQANASHGLLSAALLAKQGFHSRRMGLFHLAFQTQMFLRWKARPERGCRPRRYGTALVAGASEKAQDAQ